MPSPLISIGKLAHATGLSVERLRIWELRYGAPSGQRLPSGHRRYAVDEVERLHLVREALARGWRPRQAVALPREALQGLLESIDGAAVMAGPRGAKALPWTPLAWVHRAARMDEAALERQFMEHWSALGSLRFLKERAVPFQVALGEEWHQGRLRAAEEHFGSEKLGDFLAAIWRRLNEQNRGETALLTTLPGDPYRIGLQMAALVAVVAGMKVLYLGPSTPLNEVSETALKQGVASVLISVSHSLPADDAGAALGTLRAAMPASVSLVVGGAGAPAPEGGAWRRFDDLQSFYAWARGRRAAGVA